MVGASTMGLAVNFDEDVSEALEDGFVMVVMEGESTVGLAVDCVQDLLTQFVSVD